MVLPPWLRIVALVVYDGTTISGYWNAMSCSGCIESSIRKSLFKTPPGKRAVDPTPGKVCALDKKNGRKE